MLASIVHFALRFTDVDLTVGIVIALLAALGSLCSRSFIKKRWAFAPDDLRLFWFINDTFIAAFAYHIRSYFTSCNTAFPAGKVGLAAFLIMLESYLLLSMLEKKQLTKKQSIITSADNQINTRDQ